MYQMTEKAITAAEDKESIWSKSTYNIGNCYELYTTDKDDMRRAVKLADKYPDDVQIVKDDKYGMTFRFSMDSGSLFWRPKQKRVMTEEQKNVLRDRLVAMREKNIG